MIKVILIMFTFIGSCFAYNSYDEFLNDDNELIENHTIIERNHKPDVLINKQDTLKVLVWNIFKFKKENIFRDLNLLMARNNIIMLQEDHLTPQARQEFSQNNLYDFYHMTAPSFLHNDFITGVTTSTKYKVERSYGLRSPVTEPVIKTPKMSSYTYFIIKDSQNQLLVVNLHGINFVTTKIFKKHIDQMIAEIKKHSGPVIFGGDFNTRNKSRTNYLLEQAEPLGLKLAIPNNEYRRFQLDHVLIRGLNIIKVELLRDIKSSDHPAIEGHFKLNL